MNTRHCIQVGEKRQEPHPEEQRLEPAHPEPAHPEPASLAEVSELEPSGEEEAGVVSALAVDLAEVDYSIRIPEPRRRLDCPRCDTSFLATGPTGHEAGRPICDLCLLEGSHQLGVLLALASAARVFGAFEPEDRAEFTQALSDYGAFARIYDLIAARSGPPRLFPSGVVGS